MDVIDIYYGSVFVCVYIICMYMCLYNFLAYYARTYGDEWT